MQLELLEKPQCLTRAQARRDALLAAQTRAQVGMDRAAGAAELDVPGWIEQAVEALRRFVRAQVGVFAIEQARAVIGRELPEVPELRVWGKVTQLAAQRGVISPVLRTFIPAASSNGAPKPAWKRGPNA
jgi:hypothetical protein